MLGELIDGFLEVYIGTIRYYRNLWHQAHLLPLTCLGSLFTF